MSNLKSASLTLKTADLIDNTKNYLVGTISGYISSTSQFMVANITTGLLPTYGSLSTTTSTLKYYGATENTTGAVSLSSTTTATTATTTQSCSLSGGFILQIATLSISGCTIAGTTLSITSSQSLTAGMYISGSGIIPGTTITTTATSTTFTISASHTISTATTLNFFTPNTAIVANLGVSSTNVAGIYTVGGVVFNTSGNPQWQHSGPVLTYGTRTCTFYPLTQYTVYSFDPSSSTQVGSCNNIRSLYSWNNLNLRTLLGDMWDKYSSFNLCLEYIGTSYPIIPNSITNDNLAVNIKMSGFNFINSTYEIKNNCNVSNIVLSPFIFSTNTPSNVYLSNASQYTFLKNNDIFNINIEYERIVDGKSPLNASTGIINSAMNVPYPNMIYIFKIFGCDPIDTNNASRIKNI